jgi:very-short-patch-repair endonuclease
MLERAASSGRIIRLAHGVYVAPDAAATDPCEQHLQAALAHQLRNPQLIASHATAALAWGLDLADTRGAATSAPAFIAPMGSGLRSGSTSRARVHSRDLPTQHRTTHPSGLYLTTPHRTAVDVASELKLPEALVTLDSTLRLDLRATVGERGLRRAYRDTRLLERLGAPLLEVGHAAATQHTRRWLSEVLPMADPRRESAAESLSFGHFALAGLPLPELQARIETSEGDLFADFLWADQMVIGEVDGAMKYQRTEDLVAEKRRQERIERLGFLVVRWMTDEILIRPGGVVARVRDAIDARS